MEIRGIGAGPGIITADTTTTPVSKAGEGQGFKEALASSLEDVDALKKAADKSIMDMAAGKGEDIHKVMIAIEKADVSFQFMLQVRNKAINAYEDIMRMTV